MILHQNHLGEMVLIRGHNICFMDKYGNNTCIIPVTPYLDKRKMFPLRLEAKLKMA